MTNSLKCRAFFYAQHFNEFNDIEQPYLGGPVKSLCTPTSPYVPHDLSPLHFNPACMKFDLKM